MFNNKGFSLIEVLIALVILGIGILAIAGMQITSIRGNFFSDNIMQASILGQDKMEGLRDLPLTHTSLSNGQHGPEVIDIRGTSFSRVYTVATDAGIPANSRLITVNVIWTDTSDHTISFSTVKSPP